LGAEKPILLKSQTESREKNSRRGPKEWGEGEVAVQRKCPEAAPIVAFLG
jgi:hypothetical protein